MKPKRRERRAKVPGIQVCRRLKKRECVTFGLSPAWRYRIAAHGYGSCGWFPGMTNRAIFDAHVTNCAQA